MPHLSIGEVLGLLLEEFPDVTISKIRFLESQGLIDPERTPSGYRKFYDDDVELLRCILREQRENYLPLRVIKDRIDSGEIDPTGEQLRPRGIRNVGDGGPFVARDVAVTSDAEHVTGAAALFVRTDGPRPTPSDPLLARPDEQQSEPLTEAASAPEPAVEAIPATPPEPTGRPSTPALAPGELLDAHHLCSLSGVSHDELEQLMSYGVLTAESSGGLVRFNEDALDIAREAKPFLAAGVDARHLRGWRVAADREAGLLDQLVQPLLRQRNPEARAHAVEQLRELEAVGGRLRSAMMRAALRSLTH
ncbi:MAG: MerR family transcriptional regulator [Ilumatobacteraceae bacterium]